MIDRRRRTTFEEVADAYQTSRFSYPEELVEDVLRISALPPQGRILEIGCGPGNSTLPFALRGYNILAVELGAQLAGHAARLLQPYPNARVICSAFEAWEEEPAAFDLVISADAFHWIDPQVGFARLGRALKPGAWAAFWWNAPVPQPADQEGFKEIDEVYQRIAPQAGNPEKRFTIEWLEQVGTKIFAGSGLFQPPQIHTYLRSEAETTQHYIQSLRTYSGHAGLDEETRQRLYAELAEVIDRRGGSIRILGAVVLFIARLLG